MGDENCSPHPPEIQFCTFGVENMKQGDPDEQAMNRAIESAIATFEDTKKPYTTTDMMESADGICLQTSIDLVMQQRGDIGGAIDALEEAKVLRERTGDIQNDEAARLMHDLGALKLQGGDLEG